MADQHDLTADQKAQLLNAQIERLRAERYQHELNIVRWSAIPAELQDGTEAGGIEQARTMIKVGDAQIEALSALAEPEPAHVAPNRAQRRASARKK